MNLNNLKIGQEATIIHCNDGKLPLKLMEMGCVTGERIFFIGKAPFGTPYYYKIGDTRIALGIEIVNEIEVDLLDG